MNKSTIASLFAVPLTVLSPAWADRSPTAQDVNVVNGPLEVVTASDLAITTSALAVILPNNWPPRAEARLGIPDCDYPNVFLVTAIHVAPEFEVGNTNRDVLKLGKWAVSVPVYQHYKDSSGGTAAVSVKFSVFGDGPNHLAASLPAGQAWPNGMGEFRATVWLLNGLIASDARYEFNVHVTGRCGMPFFVAG